MVKIPELKEQIPVPENIEINLDNNCLTIKGEKGELKKVFSHPKIAIKTKDKNIELTGKNIKRKDKSLMGTWVAHINNMIKGVNQGFTYKMKTVFSHFPIKTSVEGEYFVIQNFLGERSPRKAKILEGVNVEAKGENITLTGIDKEKIGQTVANIERATAVKRRDIRVYQDGVYRIAKGD